MGKKYMESTRMRIDVINYSSRKNGNGYHIAEYIKEIILRENRECDLIDFSRFLQMLVENAITSVLILIVCIRTMRFTMLIEKS